MSKKKPPKKSDQKELADEIRLAFSSDSIPDKYKAVIEQIHEDLKSEKNNTNGYFIQKYGINLALAKVASMVHQRFSKAMVLASDKIEHEQTDRVLALAVQGFSNRQISDQTGLTVSAIMRHMNKAGLENSPRDPIFIRKMINLEILRLDSMYQTYFKSAQCGDVLAAKICLQISERRSKLLGLDSPTIHAILTANVESSTLFDLSKLTDEELATFVKLQEKVEDKSQSETIDVYPEDKE